MCSAYYYSYYHLHHYGIDFKKTLLFGLFFPLLLLSSTEYIDDIRFQEVIPAHLFSCSQIKEAPQIDHASEMEFKFPC